MKVFTFVWHFVYLFVQFLCDTLFVRFSNSVCVTVCLGVNVGNCMFVGHFFVRLFVCPIVWLPPTVCAAVCPIVSVCDTLSACSFVQLSVSFQKIFLRYFFVMLCQFDAIVDNQRSKINQRETSITTNFRWSFNFSHLLIFVHSVNIILGVRKTHSWTGKF